MATEIRIDHDKISDPHKVTQVTEQVYREHGLNKSVHIPLDVQDDPQRRQRIIKVRTTKIFDMGRRG